jgi:16S rRNA (guanine527-N7)-methyltransferase
METASNQRIANILQDYGVRIGPDSPLVDGISRYISLLLRWNRTISLTTVTDPEEIVRFHFGESLFATSSVPTTNGRLADVGSGAGFPGLPIKMLLPSLDLTLIESNAKKSAFLAEVVRELDLAHVRVFRGRMEELEREAGSGSVGFDFVTARAFGQFGELLAWSEAHLANSGKLALWLGENDAASISGMKGWAWSTPKLIPGSKRRFILVGSPQRS